RPPPPLPHALGSGRPSLGHPLLLRLDADAARRYVDPSGRVARDRTRDLFRLRSQTLDTAKRRLTKASSKGVTQQRHATTSRNNVTQQRHATTSRNNVTQRRRTPSRDALGATPLRDGFVPRPCSTYLVVMLNGVPVPPERAVAAKSVAAVLAPGARVALTTHVNADGD